MTYALWSLFWVAEPFHSYCCVWSQNHISIISNDFIGAFFPPSNGKQEIQIARRLPFWRYGMGELSVTGILHVPKFRVLRLIVSIKYTYIMGVPQLNLI